MDNININNPKLTRRKLLRLTSIGLASTIGITACNAPTATPTPENRRLVLAASKEFSDPLKKMLADFNIANKTITVELRELEGNSTTLKDTYTRFFAQKDTSVDIILTDNGGLAEFTSANWLIPLDNTLTTKEREQFFEPTLQAATFKGGLYGLPLYNHIGMLYYRKDLLEAAGLTPPSTFDELAETAAKLQNLDDGIFGFIWSAFPTLALSNSFLEILGGFGGDFWNPTDATITVNSEAGENTLNWWLDNINTRKISPVQVTAWRINDIITIFNQGQAIFMQTSSEFYPQSQTAPSQIIDKVGLAPLIALTGQKPSGLLNSTYLAISAFSKYRTEAATVLKALTAPASAKVFALATGNPPGSKELYQDKVVLNKYPYFAAIGAALANGKIRPAGAAYPQISAEVLQAQLIRVLQQKTSVKEALQIITDKAQPLVKV